MYESSSQMNKTRANMRHFDVHQVFHQLEKNIKQQLALSIFRMSIIADFLNPYYTT